MLRGIAIAEVPPEVNEQLRITFCHRDVPNWADREWTVIWRISLRSWLWADGKLVRVGLACSGIPLAWLWPILESIAIGWCHKLRKLLGPAVTAGLHCLGLVTGPPCF